MLNIDKRSIKNQNVLVLQKEVSIQATLLEELIREPVPLSREGVCQR